MKKLHNWYRNLRLRNKLLLTYFIIILLTILSVSLCNYVVSQVLITRYAANYSDAITTQIAANFESQLRNIEESHFNKYQKQKAFNDLASDSPVTIEKKIAYQTALDELLFSTSYYKTVYFIDVMGNTYYSSREPTLVPDWTALRGLVSETTKGWGKCLWRSFTNQSLSFQRALYSLRTSRYIGCMFADIDTSYLSQVYESSILQYGGNIVILNEESEPLLYDNSLYVDIAIAALEQSDGKSKMVLPYEMEKYVISISPVNTSWSLVHMIPQASLTQGLHVISFWIAGIGILISILATVLAFVTSNSVSTHVNLLLNSMKKVSGGNFDHAIVPTGHDEIGILAGNFNTMILKIKELMDKITLEQKKKQDAEYQILEFRYKALQAQLNPHFLYNVLESISCIAQLRDEFEISEYICMLSDLLRESIGRKERFVTLGDEITYLKKYTTLYEMMYRERVDFFYDLDNSLEAIPVPSFLLQPVVENSILHGIEAKEGKGKISIRSYKENGALILQVEDNGQGIPADFLEGLIQGNANPEHMKSKHTKVGIQAIRDRLLILYGKEYDIAITSTYRVGTIVQIKIPIEIPF